MTERARIGIFGGSFDPIHIGHLVVAVNARYECRLDRVLMVVAAEPWQKVGERDITPADRRLAGVRAAVEGVEGVEASDIEIERGGPSYTVDTLRELKERDPDAHLFLIVGADAAAGLHTWRYPDEMAALADLVVVNRPGTAPAGLDPMWTAHQIEIPALDISSTDLRRRLAEGKPVDFLIPERAMVFVRGTP